MRVPNATALGALTSDTSAARHEIDDEEVRGLLNEVVSTQSDAIPSDMLSDLEQLDGERLRGLIITRRADSTDSSLVRLGALARRLAQKASTPVAIVPHDLRELQMSHGPVLLATAPSHTPASAARLTRQIAAVKRLKVLLVSVAQVEDIGAYSGNAEAFREAYADAERETEAQTIMWAQQNGLEHAWRQIVRGDVRFAVESAARRFDASVVVCGTRQRNILERLLAPSAALEMARYSTRPVILVPNDTRSEGR